MAASGSKPSASRQPRNFPLPTSLEKTAPQQLRNKKRKIGKEKESNAPTPWQAEPVLEGDWNHAKAGTKAWQWASLTDPAASRHSPIFTKDGRCAFISGLIFCSTEKAVLQLFFCYCGVIHQDPFLCHWTNCINFVRLFCRLPIEWA